uniref:(northern house mosquito) hypothetical protein n=2 Tax=Culex pipiens TaxID=7175 RepID=A0A8D8F6B6_CULPI
MSVRSRRQHVAVRQGNAGQRATHQIRKTDFLHVKKKKRNRCGYCTSTAVFRHFTSPFQRRLVESFCCAFVVVFLPSFAMTTCEQLAVRKFPFLLLFSFGNNDTNATFTTTTAAAALCQTRFPTSYRGSTTHRREKNTTLTPIRALCAIRQQSKCAANDDDECKRQYTTKQARTTIRRCFCFPFLLFRFLPSDTVDLGRFAAKTP